METDLGLIWNTLHGKVFPIWLEKYQWWYIILGTLWDKIVPSMKWMRTKTRDFSKGYIFELMLMEPDLGLIWNTLHGKVFSIWLEKNSKAVHHSWDIMGQICTKYEMNVNKNQRLFERVHFWTKAVWTHFCANFTILGYFLVIF